MNKILEEIHGPILTDQDGNLDRPIFMCGWGRIKCAFLLIYDWQYLYCSAQPDTFPGIRRGTHLLDFKPNKTCPFL